MDTLTHTIVAVGLIASAYYLGAYLESKKLLHGWLENMFDKLENDGYIATKTDKDGEKELVTISEVLATFNKAAIEKDKS
tara:strand:- start:122 stop:361 length:240 start_codon:yes stop_codon:yes gene_type:complete